MLLSPSSADSVSCEGAAFVDEARLEVDADSLADLEVGLLNDEDSAAVFSLSTGLVFASKNGQHDYLPVCHACVA